MRPGEIALARSVLRGAFLPFGLPDQNTAITPRGGRHRMQAQWRDQVLRERNGGKLFFIHAMAHLWQ